MGKNGYLCIVITRSIRKSSISLMKITNHLLVLAGICVCACTSTKTPVFDINSGWQFSCDDGRSATVDLPHDAMLGAKRSADAPGSGGEAYFQGGTYTYTKDFEVPAEWLTSHVMLDFDGVYRNSTVFVNGNPAGGCEYGYLPFSVCLDGLLKEGTNTIKVEVDNSAHPNSRWYPGGGIYRPVKLTVSPKEYISDVRVKTISTSPAVIEVEVDANSSGAEVKILDGTKVVAKGAPGRFEIPSAKLWSAESPNLYTAEVTLPGGDVKEEKFGIRTITWSPDGFFVNGENVLLKGGCIHHDNGIVGSADYEESAYRRVALLKKYGFNAIRSAHNPISENMLKACDELGMYVMDELWDMWFHNKTAHDYSFQFMDNYKNDIAAFVDRDYNHPSVVMYSIGNEVSEPVLEGGMDVEMSIVSELHRLDPSRPVTGGINLMILFSSSLGNDIFAGQGTENFQGEDSPMGSMFGGSMSEMTSTMYNQMVSMVGDGMSGASLLRPGIDEVISPALDELDIAGYNYGKGRYEADGTIHPDRIIVGSETMPIDIPANWEMVERLPYLVGDFMWTSWDYLGEVGIGAWSHSKDALGFSKPYPWLLADTGALDILGNPNGEALLAETTWNGKVSMAVQPVLDGDLIKAAWRGTNAIPSWSWSGQEGKDAVVEVYAKAEKVRLSLNGETVGEQDVRLNRASFTVPYAPGTLTAEAISGGDVIGTCSLKSAEGDVKIKVTAEPKRSSDDVVYFDIDLVGSNGEVWSNRDALLSVKVEGGKLLGFGSANPRTEERFQSGNYTTYFGHAQAIVKAEGPKVKISVSSEGLATAEASARIK